MAAASLPAGPLVAIVDRLLARAALDEHPSQQTRAFAYGQLAIHPRTLYAWRVNSNARVTLGVADRVLSRTNYLWFDVWPECAEHETPVSGCDGCFGHYSARKAFTGKGLPKGLTR